MKSRYLASISLAVMGTGFLITLFFPQNIWVRLLQGGFEAGLVGGFADWFAVTALFRHPMGIPIPHTSLLLQNRNKIVNSLISALESELLNKESITQKLRNMKLFKSLSTGTFKFLRKKEVRLKILDSAETMIKQIPLETAVPQIQQILLRYVQSRDISNMMDQAVNEITRHELDEKALNYVLKWGEEWIRQPENEYTLGKLAHNKLDELQLGGMKGFAVQAMLGFMSEEKMGAIIKNLILSAVDEISIPNSQYRQRIIYEVQTHLRAAVENPDSEIRIKSWLGNKLDEQETQAWIVNQLEGVRGRILVSLEEERYHGGHSLIRIFRWITNTLKSKEELLNRWEQGLLALIVQAVEANYYRIGVLVKDNLDQLDDKALVQMLEEKVGSDLQWIRVNGAICGFAIGIVLTVIHLAV